jgi:hypothetical protein
MEYNSIRRKITDALKSYPSLINSLTHYIYHTFFLFICAYNVWVISQPSPQLPPLPPCPLPLSPTPLIPGRNYFALISNFVEERV